MEFEGSGTLLELVVRLVVALLAGVVLGAPTSARHRIGGIRTHALVTLGAALFCVTGMRIAANADEIVRVVAGVATGVGFIGGATVIKRQGTVLGIATAASIWISGALGCEIGVGSPLFGLGLAAVVSAMNAALIVAQRRLLERKARLPPRAPVPP
jgi:putative Mg2+ transporter-C (MgtC) family protein